MLNPPGQSSMDQALEQLLARVSAALRHLPGALECYLFGSAADAARRDAYSDLDVQVVTHDFALSRAAWPWILNRAGRIELAFSVQQTANESTYTLALAGESPYHKIDIGLCDPCAQPGFFHGIAHKRLLWQQPADRQPVHLSANAEAYAPPTGSAAYFLMSQLLGAVRYLKARKRGQHLSCWRFLSAAFHASLRCRGWDGDAEHFPSDPLSTWDFAALDAALPESERLERLQALRVQSPAQMDATLIELTRGLAACLCPPEAHAARLTAAYLEFIESELRPG